MSYQSHADLGGREEHRAVVPEPDGTRFHAPWEARAMALTVAMGATGLWNIDESRAARETLSDYDHLSYYQIWFDALAKLVAAHGILTRHDAAPNMLKAQNVAATLRRGAPTLRPPQGSARFKAGDRVVTVAGERAHHTRLPGYARGKLGTVERLHGCHVFPDSNAHGGGESPQWLYTVVFSGRELFGAQAGAAAQVSVDAFESYLGPA